MRIHVTFIDRVGITQEVLALLGGRNLNLDAVEMVPPNVYIDAPTLSPEVLDELREALFKVRGVQAVTIVDILPGQRRHLQLDALLAAMTDIQQRTYSAEEMHAEAQQKYSPTTIAGLFLEAYQMVLQKDVA